MMWVLWVVFILSCGVFIPIGLEMLFYKLMGDRILRKDRDEDV